MPHQSQSDLAKVRAKLYTLNFSSITRGGTESTLIVDGVRVAIKTAAPKDGRWSISLHRRGVLDESNIDAYLFMLKEIPGNVQMPIYLVLPAPQGKTRFNFSLSSLMRVYSASIDNWAIIRDRAKIAA